LRELKVFLLVEAFRLSELKRMLVTGGTTRRAFPGHPARPLRAARLDYPAAFKACVARQAQYVFDTRFFRPGAYLRTHTEHMQRWHGEQQGG
jgi:hypothetical protein